MSRLFEHTKLNLERTVQNLTAQDSEFVYTDNNGTVPANKNYSMYYLTDKRELYFTGLITSKYVRQLTRIKNNTLYSQYTKIKSSKREIYPSNYVPQLKEDDYSATTGAGTNNDFPHVGTTAYTQKYLEPVIVKSTTNITKTKANDNLIQFSLDLEKSKRKRIHRG